MQVGGSGGSTGGGRTRPDLGLRLPYASRNLGQERGSGGKRGQAGVETKRLNERVNRQKGVDCRSVRFDYMSCSNPFSRSI